MTVPVIKNIKFGFIQIKNGIASIDTSMTDKAFDTNKPQGVYRCFIFPKEYFSGVDHGDLRNLVNIEKSRIWHETLRSTLLGYNAVSNEFILNLTAYYGLKDSDLKTDGNLKYSGQASWQVMTLTTTQESNSIVTLKQTDGTDAYLSIKPINLDGSGYGAKIHPPLSVEIEKKSIKDVPLLVKNDILWAKSTEDGVPIMVNNCVKAFSTESGYNISLSDNNKKYGLTISQSGKIQKFYSKSMRFGKELMYFDSTATTERSTLISFGDTSIITNKTGVSSIEYTDTSSLSDILSSGESLTFQLIPKDKYVWGYRANTEDDEDYPNTIVYKSNAETADTDALNGSSFIFGLTEFVNKNIIGYEYSLTSCDTQKPFLFNSPDRVYGVSSRVYLDADKIFENLPDGYIALSIGIAQKKLAIQSIVRWKKGESVKYRNVSRTVTNSPYYVSVNGTTKFGDEIYNNSGKLDPETVELNDIVNATGFIDILPNDKIMQNEYLSLITIVRL